MLSTNTLVLSSGWLYSGSVLPPTSTENPNWPFEGITLNALKWRAFEKHTAHAHFLEIVAAFLGKDFSVEGIVED